ARWVAQRSSRFSLFSRGDDALGEALHLREGLLDAPGITLLGAALQPACRLGEVLVSDRSAGTHKPMPKAREFFEIIPEAGLLRGGDGLRQAQDELARNARQH